MIDAASHANFVGSIPRHYHEHLGPVLFAPYAHDLASRLPRRAGLRVLEIAAGTGIVTRALLGALPADGRLTATDLNAPMLEEAEARLPRDPRLSFRTADAQALPFDDGTFDAVVIQFGVMFFPDKAAALREAHRVLAPGGVLLFNVWGTLDENPFGRIAHETIGSFFANDPPQFYCTPFGWNDLQAVRATVESAGFATVERHTVDVASRAATAAGFARGLVAGNPVAGAIADRGADLEAIVRAVAARLTEAFGTDPLTVPLRAHVVTGRR